MKLFLLQVLMAFLPSACPQQQCDASNNEDGTCTNPQDLSVNDGLLNTQPIRQLPDDFVDPCQNNNENCPQWAAEGECKNNPNFMLADCARSCGSCQKMVLGDGDEDADMESSDPDGLSCRDEHGPECGTWANQGECLINPNCEFLISVIHVIIDMSEK